jgi:hypothetical protein
MIQFLQRELGKVQQPLQSDPLGGVGCSWLPLLPLLPPLPLLLPLAAAARCRRCCCCCRY